MQLYWNQKFIHEECRIQNYRLAENTTKVGLVRLTSLLLDFAVYDLKTDFLMFF